MLADRQLQWLLVVLPDRDRSSLASAAAIACKHHSKRCVLAEKWSEGIERGFTSVDSRRRGEAGMGRD